MDITNQPIFINDADGAGVPGLTDLVGTPYSDYPPVTPVGSPFSSTFTDVGGGTYLVTAAVDDTTRCIVYSSAGGGISLNFLAGTLAGGGGARIGRIGVNQ